MLFVKQQEALLAPPLGCVVAIHGRGATSDDLIPLAEALGLPKLRFVFPEGPREVPEFALGKAWYEYPDPAHRGLLESRAALFELLNRLQSEGIPSHRIALLGFSQGAVMSLDVGLRYPKKLSGLVVLSGYLYDVGSLRHEKSSGAQQLPIFMAHGTHDGIVPVDEGRRSQEALTKEGFSVQWIEYAMDHQIIPEELSDVRKFLLELYPGAE